MAPAIHVWNSRSLHSEQIIKGLHSKGIHLLAFTNDDKLLVTCGLTAPSACIVYDWANAEIIVSMAIASPTQEIFVLPDIVSNGNEALLANGGIAKLAAEENKNNDPLIPEVVRSGVVVLSLTQIALFTLRDKSFSQSYLSLAEA